MLLQPHAFLARRDPAAQDAKIREFLEHYPRAQPRAPRNPGRAGGNKRERRLPARSRAAPAANIHRHLVAVLNKCTERSVQRLCAAFVKRHAMVLDDVAPDLFATFYDKFVYHPQYADVYVTALAALCRGSDKMKAIVAERVDAIADGLVTRPYPDAKLTYARLDLCLVAIAQGLSRDRTLQIWGFVTDALRAPAGDLEVLLRCTLKMLRRVSATLPGDVADTLRARMHGYSNMCRFIAMDILEELCPQR